MVGILLFRWRDKAADRPLRIPLPRVAARARRRRASRAARSWRRGRPASSTATWPSAYVRVLALAALALAGIFYISTFLDLSDKVFKGDATWAMLGRYFVFVTPQYVYYIMPLVGARWRRWSPSAC